MIPPITRSFGHFNGLHRIGQVHDSPRRMHDKNTRQCPRDIITFRNLETLGTHVAENEHATFGVSGTKFSQIRCLTQARPLAGLAVLLHRTAAPSLLSTTSRQSAYPRRRRRAGNLLLTLVLLSSTLPDFRTALLFAWIGIV